MPAKKKKGRKSRFYSKAQWRLAGPSRRNSRGPGAMLMVRPEQK